MIQLIPISNEDFEKDLKVWINEYAEEKVKAGTWPEEGSLERSEKEFSRLLPKGKDTPDQHILSIVDEAGTKLGSLWFGVYRDTEPFGAFIWDIRLTENVRGKGYGKETMTALDNLLKELGIGKVTLHVFAHNEVAINLYKKMGYKTTDIMMAKEY